MTLFVECLQILATHGKDQVTWLQCTESLKWSFSSFLLIIVAIQKVENSCVHLHYRYVIYNFVFALSWIQNILEIAVYNEILFHHAYCIKLSIACTRKSVKSEAKM